MRVVISDLDAVGRLVVPWRVSGRPLPTVRELTEDPEHPALHVVHPDFDGWTHAGRIEQKLGEPQSLPELILPAVPTGASYLLIDGCHRTCALYRSRPSHWTLTLIVADRAS